MHKGRHACTKGGTHAQRAAREGVRWLRGMQRTGVWRRSSGYVRRGYRRSAASSFAAGERQVCCRRTAELRVEIDRVVAWVHAATRRGDRSKGGREVVPVEATGPSRQQSGRVEESSSLTLRAWTAMRELRARCWPMLLVARGTCTWALVGLEQLPSSVCRNSYRTLTP